MQSKHLAISLMPHEFLWRIMNTEKSLLEEIWANCYKQKKTHKSKGKGTSGLVILGAHSLHLVLQQVFLIYTLYGGLTMQ